MFQILGSALYNTQNSLSIAKPMPVFESKISEDSLHVAVNGSMDFSHTALVRLTGYDA